MSGIWDSNSIKTLMGKTSGLPGLIGDYNSIKSGSYGKLLKSYYGQATGSTSAKSASAENIADKLMYERRNPAISKESATANSKLNTSVGNLTGALSTLQDAATYKDTEGGSSAKDKAVSAVKSYVSAYNDSVESSKKSTLTNVTKNIAGVMKASTANSSDLKEIGVSINSNGTLSLDEKKLSSADADTIKKLFDGKDASSYGSAVASRMNRVSFYTSDPAASGYSATGGYNTGSYLSSMFSSQG